MPEEVEDNERENFAVSQENIAHFTRLLHMRKWFFSK